MGPEVGPKRFSQHTQQSHPRRVKARTSRSIWWYESEVEHEYGEVPRTDVHLNIDGMTIEQAIEVLLTCAEDLRRSQLGEPRVAVMLEPDDVGLIETALIEARQTVTLPSQTLDRISRARQRCFKRNIR